MSSASKASANWSLVGLVGPCLVVTGLFVLPACGGGGGSGPVNVPTDATESDTSGEDGRSGPDGGADAGPTGDTTGDDDGSGDDDNGCEPRTCEEAEAECGSVSDGCGGTLECGGCDGRLTCGGGGEENRCGGDCPGGCPSGFSCDRSRGVCEGGSATDMSLNVDTATVSGDVTIDGAAPAAEEDCNNEWAGEVMGRVVFEEVDRDYTFSHRLDCSDDSYQLDLVPGSYDVYLGNFGSGTRSNFPSPNVRVAEGVDVSGDSSLDVGLRRPTVSGDVRVDGAAPVAEEDCNNEWAGEVMGRVVFREVDRDVTFSHRLDCSDDSYHFDVVPGTYDVFLGNFGEGTRSNIPSPNVRTDEGVEVSGDTTVDVGVQRAAVSGNVTIDGAAPVAEEDCNNEWAAEVMGRVVFEDVNRDITFAHRLDCSDDSYQLDVVPGTYDVALGNFGSGTRSNFPSPNVRAEKGVEVSGDTTVDVGLQRATVSGEVTIDGAAPVAEEDCNNEFAGEVMGRVVFREVDRDVTFSHRLDCSDDSYEFQVVPGSYDVFLGNFGNGTHSNIPSPNVRAAEDVEVSGDETVDVGLQRPTVSGSVTIDGAAPAAEEDCNNEWAGEVMGRVVFEEVDRDYTFSHRLDCSDDSYQLDVVPGTYDVYLGNFGSGTRSNFPSPNVRATEGVDVSGDTSVDVGIDTVAVSGSVTVDGAAPVAEEDCNDEYVGDGMGRVTFREVDHGYTFVDRLSCSDTSFEKDVVPGTYRVFVGNRGTSTRSNVPEPNIVVHPRIRLAP